LLGGAKTTKASRGDGTVSSLRPCISTWHRIPTSRNATALWETCCCVTLRCVVRLRLIVSWPSKFLFGSALLHANKPLKNVPSEFEFPCKITEPLDFTQSASRVVSSTVYGNIINKIACFSRIFHLIAKGHVKNCSMRDHDRYTSRYLSLTTWVATWVWLFLLFIFEQLKLTLAKN